MGVPIEELLQQFGIEVSVAQLHSLLQQSKQFAIQQFLHSVELWDELLLLMLAKLLQRLFVELHVTGGTQPLNIEGYGFLNSFGTPELLVCCCLEVLESQFAQAFLHPSLLMSLPEERQLTFVEVLLRVQGYVVLVAVELGSQTNRAFLCIGIALL